MLSSLLMVIQGAPLRDADIAERFLHIISLARITRRKGREFMDPQRFDRFARELGNRTDRRSAVKSVAAGALAMLGVTAIARQSRAASGKEGDTCTTSSDCETGLICEGANSGLLGGLIASGPYGPPYASTVFGPSDGTCRYRSDNCAKSGQYCDRTSDCCNGLNLECRGHECQRRN